MTQNTVTNVDKQTELSPIKRALLTISRLEAENERLKTREPIAIIGMACRLPGAVSPEALWTLLEAGHDAVTEGPSEQWRHESLFDLDPQAPGGMTWRHGAFCEGIDLFDADFFDISPREVHAMDPQQRMLLEVTWEALERANQNPEGLYGSPTGVFMGLGTFDYAASQLARIADVGIDRHFVSGTVLSVAAGRISYALGLNGPCMTIDTACSSSLVALHQACRSLQQGESSLALAGGVGLMMSPVPSIAFSKAQMLSPSGRCHTFAAAADGYVRGEGCSVVVLKRLADAKASGDDIIGIIRATAVNQDGASGGLTVPSGPAQEALMRAACQSAGIAPADVAYVEAHGTGTPLGDLIELRSIAKVYGGERANSLLVGSLKTNFGHLEAAAGVAGLIKVLLSLRHGRVPAHLHFDRPNPDFDWQRSRLKVPRTLMDWPAASRIAAVNAFGFSGTNAHVIVEAPERSIVQSRSEPGSPQLLVLSSKSLRALARLAAVHAEHLESLSPDLLRDYCATAAVSRSAFPYRLSSISASPRELAQRLRCFADTGSAEGLTVGHSRTVAAESPSLLDSVDSRLLQFQEAFLRGKSIDWPALFGPAPWQKLPLPITPLIKERFWFDQLSDRFSAAPFSGSLLGEPFYSPFAAATLYQGQPAAFRPLLDDHIVFGSRVLAGASFIAAALEAVAPEGRCVMHNICFVRALVVSAECDLKLQIAVMHQASTQTTLVIKAGSSDAMEPWSDYFTASIQTAVELDASPLLSELKARCHVPVDVARLYDHAERHGISLRTRFRRLHHVWHADGEALGCCPVPQTFNAKEAGGFHPGLIDAGFQLLLAALGDEYRHTLVPTRIDRLTMTAWPDLEQSIWCHLKLTRQDLGSAMADVCFFSEDGHELMTISGFEVRRIDSATLIGQEETAATPVLLEVEWREKRFFRPGFSFLNDSYLTFETEHLAAYRAGLIQLERACVVLAAHTYKILAKDVNEAVAGTMEAIAERLGIAPTHHRLHRHLLHLLAREGFLVTSSANRYELIDSPCPDPNELLAEMERMHPLVSVERSIVARCGVELASVLRGDQDPLQLLFPAGDVAVIADTYAGAFATRMLNRVIQQLIADWATAAGDGPIRVLEVGAGTGATTRPVLEGLPQTGVSYTLTDVSQTLLDSARRTLDLGRGLEFKHLDIERQPEAQGFELNGYDIIIAANVLHATRNLVDSLSHVRSLLADGGMFLLVEATIPQNWLDLTFGLMTGWWRFEDERTLTNHPLLSGEEWVELLNRSGFAEAQVLTDEQALGQAVILARAAPMRARTGPWLLVADQGGIVGQLKASITSSDEECLVVVPEDALETLQRLRLEERLPSRLVHLSLLDLPVASGLDPQEMFALVSERCSEIVSLLQAAATLPQPLALTVVARGALAACPGDLLSGLAAAMVPGVVKVAALEHPELSPRFIDIDDASAEMLHVAILGQGRDVELAIRHNRHWVPRLVRCLEERDDIPTFSGDGYYLITGGHGGIGMALAGWLVEHGARHLALISRRPADEAIQQKFGDWRQAGVTVESLVLDIADAESMTAALAGLSETRPIRGVFHAAGILEDAILANQTADRLQATFAPKVFGAWLLHRLTAHQPLDHFVLFSSAAAMLGSTGQSAHAAANAWLDAFAWYRSGLGLPACTVNWGAWSRIGQAARLGQAQDFRRQGIGMISPEEGLAILGATMSAKAIQRGAIPLDLPVFLSTRPRWGLYDDLKVDLDVPGQRLHQSVDQAVDLPAILEELGAVLGRREAANIDPDRDFAALGLDSLATLDLRNRLQRRSGLILSPAAMFEYSTARLLAGHLAMLSSTAIGTEDLDSTLSAERAMVDSLSESELDALLSELLTEEDAIN